MEERVKRLLLQTCKNKGLFGKGLRIHENYCLTINLTLGKKPFENIVGKEDNSGDKHFLLFSEYCLPYMALIFHFRYTLKCCLQFV